MVQEAFELIAARIMNELGESGFTKFQEGNAASGKPVIFVGENVAYAVVYNNKVKRFDLKMADVAEGKPSENWKNLSQWLFNDQEDTLQDAESIANDFVDTVAVDKKKEKVVAAKNAKKDKNGEKTVDAVFLFNRLSAIFPEMRYSLQAMKNEFGGVLAVYYTKEEVLPLVRELLQQGKSDRTAKMTDIFNSCYKNGGLDVKGLITTVLFNGLDENLLKVMQEDMSEELKKASKTSWKLRGKKIKPEVNKPQKRMTSQEALNTLRNK